jgi:hypothetical protein
MAADRFFPPSRPVHDEPMGREGWERAKAGFKAWTDSLGPSDEQQ